MSDIAKEIVDQLGKLESERSTLDQHCKEVAELVYPSHSVGWQNEVAQKGEKRSQRQYDATATLALQRYASALKGWIAPRGNQWHRIKTSDDTLNEDPEVKEYFDLVTDALFRTRYEPQAAFDSALDEAFLQVGAFGTCCVFTDKRTDTGSHNMPLAGLRYRGIAFSQIFACEDASGMINRVYRRFKLTARQAVDEFGDAVSDEIQNTLKTNPFQEFEFIHCVEPNAGYNRSKMHAQAMRYASFYVERAKPKLLRHSGFGTLRYAMGRNTKGPDETYGRGPAMMMLPEIKMLNEMRRTLVRAQHQAVMPPWGIAGETNRPLRLIPNAINPGTVGPDGRPLAVPLVSSAKFEPATDEINRIRESINDAFLLSLFQILVDRPQQTATETLQRAKEQAILVAPIIMRLQSELMGQIIESELDILTEYGALPEMPDALMEAQGEYEIEYDTDVTRAMALGEIEGYANWMAENAPVIEMRPELLDVLDHEAILRKNAERRGVDQRFIRTDDDLAALRKAKNEQARAAQMAEQAPALSQAALNSAKADQIANEQVLI